MNHLLLKISTIVLIVFSYGQALWASDFLSPEQAFVFKAKVKGVDSVQVSFDIAPNYYMYKDEFNFSLVARDGFVKQNGEIKMPISENKFDENFNKIMSIYHRKFMVSIPIKNISDSDALFKVVVSSRGCANQGLCYPPRITQAVLTVGAAKDGSSSSFTVPSIKEDMMALSKAVSISKVDDYLSKLDEVQVGEIHSKTKNPNPQNKTQPSEDQDKTTLPDLVTAKEVSMSLDNTTYARNILNDNNSLMSLVLIFAFGLLLSLTPCMLPMIPVLSTILAGMHDVKRGRGFFLALAYVTGMALVYAILGIIAAQTGSGLFHYLQTPWVLGIFSLILVFLALSLFDIFQLQLPLAWQQWVTSRTQNGNGYVSVLLFGAASALIASPCLTAPLIAVITYIAQTGNIIFGGLALFLLAYGMGVPLLLLGAGFGRLVPKSGAWMLRLKKLIGLLMLVAALWISQPLLIKYWHAAWGTSQSSLDFKAIANSADLDAVVSRSNRPILLDLYADWCRSCIEMERKTFSDSAVREKLSQMTLVRVDMSEYTDDHAVLLRRFSLYGPPAVIVLTPLDGEERLRVIGFEPKDIFLEHITGVSLQ